MFPIDNSHIRFNGYYFGQPLWNDLYHMGEDYDAEVMMAEHLRLANRIFKSLVM